VDEQGFGPAARLHPPRALFVEQRTVGDPHGGQVEHGTEVDGETSPAEMIAARRVHDQHVGADAQGPEGGLEQRPLAQSQQPRLVLCPGDSLDDGSGEDLMFADDGRRRPRPVTGRADTFRAPREAHETAADRERLGILGTVRRGSGSGEVVLDAPEIVGRDRPAPYPRAALRSRQPMRPAARAITPTATHGKPSAAEGRPLLLVVGRVVVGAAAADVAKTNKTKDSRTPATARLTAATVAAARSG